MTAATPRKASSTDRARLQMRLSRQNVRAADDDDDFNDTPPGLQAGKANADGDVITNGSAFDWTDGLYTDPETLAVYDGGDSWARNCREMFRSYAKAVQIRTVLAGPLMSATWKLVPGEGDAGEAKDTEERLRRKPKAGGMSTPIGTVIGQMTSAQWARKAFFVKTYKLDPKLDGKVLFRDIAFRPAATCRLRLDESGGFQGFEQDVQLYPHWKKGATKLRDTRVWDGKPIGFKPEQSLVYVHGRHIDPIAGASDLEIAYWCWRTQQKVFMLLVRFLEAQALPRTLVKHDGDDTRAKQAATMIAGLGASGVGWLGQGLDAQVLDASGKGSASFVEAIKLLDSWASGSVLAGWLDLASEASNGHGSLALSEDHSDFFTQGRVEAANELAECLDSFAVADLTRYNWGRNAAMPTFTFDPLTGVDDGPVLTLLQALSSNPAAASLLGGFVQELVIEAARILELDEDKVRASVEKAAEDARKQAEAAGAGQVGQETAKVNGAANAVRTIAAKVAKGSKK